MSASQSTVPSLPTTSKAMKALRRVPWWIAFVFLVGVAILWVYPFVWMVSASLKDNMEVSPPAST